MEERKYILQNTYFIEKPDLFDGESSSSDKVDPFPYWMVTLAHGYQHTCSLLKQGKVPLRCPAKPHRNGAFRGIHPLLCVECSDGSGVRTQLSRAPPTEALGRQYHAREISKETPTERLKCVFTTECTYGTYCLKGLFVLGDLCVPFVWF